MFLKQLWSRPFTSLVSQLRSSLTKEKCNSHPPQPHCGHRSRWRAPGDPRWKPHLPTPLPSRTPSGSQCPSDHTSVKDARPWPCGTSACVGGFDFKYITRENGGVRRIFVCLCFFLPRCQSVLRYQERKEGEAHRCSPRLLTPTDLFQVRGPHAHSSDSTLRARPQGKVLFFSVAQPMTKEPNGKD